ncbi:MAG: hypothetical protein KDG89_09510 [Geminicoccaceae bacterium]|nr:hypothetical protein [Geminicoccaceae bacterium]
MPVTRIPGSEGVSGSHVFSDDGRTVFYTRSDGGDPATFDDDTTTIRAYDIASGTDAAVATATGDGNGLDLTDAAAGTIALDTTAALAPGDDDSPLSLDLLAVDDKPIAHEGETVRIDVLANDIDADGNGIALRASPPTPPRPSPSTTTARRLMPATTAFS